MGESVRLGQGTCPVCGSPKARYTLSSKGLPVVTCNSCNFQGFARSERSDELLRAHLLPEAPAAVPAPAPVPPGGDVPPPAADLAPAPPTVQASTRRSLMSW